MNNLILFVNEFLSYVLIFIIFVLVMIISGVVGVRIRKNKDAKLAMASSDTPDDEDK